MKLYDSILFSSMLNIILINISVALGGLLPVRNAAIEASVLESANPAYPPKPSTNNFTF